MGGAALAGAIAVTAEQRAAVEGLLRQPALRPRLRERLELVKAAAQGYDLAAIAAWAGRSVETVRHWPGRFVTGGVAAPGDAPRSGRPPEAGAAYLARLAALVETPPRACGLPCDVWTSARLSAAPAARTGVRIAPSWLRTLLARRRFASGRPRHTLAHLQDPAEVAACEAALAAVGGKVAAEPERYERHHQDETPLETTPRRGRVGHRKGTQPTVPAAGTNRRVTAFGSVEVFGRGRVEVVCAGPDSACFLLYLEALDARRRATGRAVFLALDNGPAHTSEARRAALAARKAWLHVVWLARPSPPRNPQEREWRALRHDARGHLARTLREFVDEILAGLRQLGGERLDIADRVPAWFIAGHRRAPTGRPPGRPKGAKDGAPRKPRGKNLPAAT